jgi:SH3-like domain-containing protein
MRLKPIAALALALMFSGYAVAQDRGTETNLPLPRFVSLKTSEGNVRRGPSTDQRVDWVFTARDMPLKLTAEYGHWRKVEDKDGVGGWIHYTLLSGNRTAIVTVDLSTLHNLPEAGAGEIARLEVGVLARISECRVDWCKVATGGYKGWIEKSSIWGVNADESFE